MPEVIIKGFALNHNNFFERTTKKLVRLAGHEYKDKITARLLSKVMQSYQPQLVIVVDLFYFPNVILEVFQKYKTHCYYTHWIGDFFDKKILRSQCIFDHYYFTDTALLKYAKSIGLKQSSYLPLAYNPRIFFPPTTEEKRSTELLFIGAWSENREQLIKSINAPMLIIGKGWEKHHKKKHRVIGKNIRLNDVAKYYQKHMFVLNIINSNNIKNGLNMRCFEAPACKALLITDQVADLSLCYQAGKEVIVYGATNMIFDILRSERSIYQNVIDSGYKKVYGHHTYKMRIKFIIRNKS